MKFKFELFIVVAAFFIGFAAVFFQTYWRDEQKNTAMSEPARSEAWEALDFWTRSRAYPNDDIPPDKYYQSYAYAKRSVKESILFPEQSSIWQPIGPLNFGGRMTSVALNPLNPNTVYAGSASGGLWRSTTGSVGGNWQRVTTGFPALGVMALAIDPTDTNTMYIGTGEVYRYQGSVGGTVIRTTMGSYGIGILKTTNGGATWTKSLDWSADQRRGVEAMRINPLNHNTIFAATSEGIYRSTNAGGTWGLILSVVMGEDIVIKSNDSTRILASCGDLASSGTGVYRSTDGGSTWSLLGGGLPSFTGKTLLEINASNPNTVFASVSDSLIGKGLWKTADFGTAWTQIHNVNIPQSQGWFAHFVAVHPTDSMQVVHGGVNIYKSTTGGSSPTQVVGPHVDQHGYAHHPTDPNILYIANDGGIYRSTDFGTSFTNLSSGLQTAQFYNGFSNSTSDSSLAMGGMQDNATAIYRGNPSFWNIVIAGDGGWTAINPSDDNIMYGEFQFNNIQKSIDQGTSFAAATTGIVGGGAAYVAPIVISQSNPSILYTARRKVFKSTDGAGSWSSTNGDVELDGNSVLSLAISPQNPDSAFAGTAPAATSAHVFRTTNGGTSWTNITGTLPDRYPMDIAVDPQNSGKVYVVYSGYGTGHVFKSTDAGANWANITGILPDLPTSSIIVDPLNSNHVYVGNDIGVYVSTNGGTSWATFNNGLPEAVIAMDLSISSFNRKLRVATHGNGVFQRGLLYAPTLSLTADILSFTHNITLDSVLTFGASVHNNGSLSQTDSVTLKIRILNKSSIEIFSSTKKVCCLTPNEAREISFNGTFVPPDTGDFTFEFIKNGSSFSPPNDTVDQLIRVERPGLITLSSVQKLYCPYTEIVPSAVITGDDNQLSLALPFPFMFDSYQYDSVQYSTNGWLEFGTGARGSERGLSTSVQLGLRGASENGRLFSTQHPTKAIGPWWEDLNTAGDVNSTVGYLTLGSSPTRTFVVQWKNVLAYYDQANTTTRINFQLRLHEGSSMIEFDYGPVVAGTFGGSDIGAMMGLKDHIGGDYHYYDIALGGTGIAAIGITNLSPLTDWPGPDSCFHIATSNISQIVSLDRGWNLISLPFNRPDNVVSSIFPTALYGTTFKYASIYVRTDTLIIGRGYWTKFPSAMSQELTGPLLPSVTVALNRGWNIIGSVDHEVSVPHGGIVSSSVFGYSAHYSVASTLQPGKGYWVKASTSGNITLGPSSIIPKTSADDLDTFSTITVTDQHHNYQTLYIAENTNGALNLDRYEMPPVPPPGSFDVRFKSQRMLETYPVDLPGAMEFPLSLQAAAYPLVISHDIKNANKKSIIIEELYNGKVIAFHNLVGEGKTTITTGGEEHSFVLKVVNGLSVPKEYALRQNYPNPFNPTTKITFDLPVMSRVSLKLYDILGREIQTLAEGEYDEGSHSIAVDFTNRASGIYLYRLEARNSASSSGKLFSDVKKLMFIK